MAVIVASSCGGFTLSTTTISSTSAFASSDILSVPNQLQGRPIIINGLVGANDALGHMTITCAATPGGTHTDLLVDPDGTTSNMLLFGTASGFSTAANGNFRLIITCAMPEMIFKFKAAASNTTCLITGTIMGGNQDRQ